MKTAIFPGTFNPFTIGHRSIVERGLIMFDRIIIAIGHNENKPEDKNIVKRVEEIRRVFNDSSNVEVLTYGGLTAEFTRKVGACAILRGVRNIQDFEYERTLADINKNVLGVETVFLLSLPEFSYISSSMVRELAANGYNISRFLP